MGRFISSFAVFLVGTIYPVLLIMFLLLGLYLIVKREAPNYFSSKLLGLYTFILALLIFLHIDYVTMNDLKGVTIFKETIDNVLLTFKNVDAISNTGGGIFGALLSFVFVSLFSIEGTKIVVGGLVVLGFILFLNSI